MSDLCHFVGHASLERVYHESSGFRGLCPFCVTLRLWCVCAPMVPNYDDCPSCDQFVVIVRDVRFVYFVVNVLECPGDAHSTANVRKDRHVHFWGSCPEIRHCYHFDHHAPLW
jgi:hypothetical protein